jgi:tetrahydromethanopterin S-methyltransferase subunit C
LAGAEQKNQNPGNVEKKYNQYILYTLFNIGLIFITAAMMILHEFQSPHTPSNVWLKYGLTYI